MITRRGLLLTGAGGLAFVAALRLRSPVTAKSNGLFEVAYSDAEWHARLTPDQYAVLRDEGTERPYTSPLNEEKHTGVFACAGCDLPLFSSTTKFDSGTGWPSFWKPLDKAVGTTTDSTLGISRTAVFCRRCGGHLGHVFDDGPPPTGLRYCMNGVAMVFKAAG